MQKTAIDWCNYSFNPIKGWCKNTDCEVYEQCYAHRMMQRFKRDRKIRFDAHEFMQLLKKKIKPGSIIFINSMIEMWGDFIHDFWKTRIIRAAEQKPELNFITLTKKPESLVKFLPFPKNLFWGVSITSNAVKDRAGYKYQQMQRDFTHMERIIIPDIISFEPLLGACNEVHIYRDLKWAIIGGLTPSPVHHQEWIDDIVARCRACDIPIFIKENAHYHTKIQEYPKEFSRGVV